MRHDVRINGKRQAIYDPMGKDAVLLQQPDDGDSESTESLFVAQTKQWFDSVWTTIATRRDL